MKPHGLTTLLLDLDGTLLTVDMEVFIPRYIKKLSSFFSHMMGPQDFARELMASTRAVIANVNPEKSNETVFFEEFTRRTNTKKEELTPVLDYFYTHEFPKLRPLSSPHPHTLPLLVAAQKKGLEVVVATNPIFPGAAIMERLRWAGINHGFPFRLVTTLENMHFCKPHPRFYTEIAEKISRSPSSCLMAGNDAVEDLVAAEAGMWTYMVEDMPVNMKEEKPQSNWSGRLEDLVSLVLSL